MVAIKQALLLISLVILVLALSTLLQRLVGPPVPFGGPGAQGPRCTAVGGKPDARCTPGALDPQFDAMSDADAAAYLCVPGRSKELRPPVSVTNPLKRASLADYGIPEADGMKPGASEGDHLVPNKLGGATTRQNIWAEMAEYPDGSPGFHVKDRVELFVIAQVCDAHALTIHQAAKMMAEDWTQFIPQTQRVGVMLGEDALDPEGEP